MSRLFDEIFALSPGVRYVATYRDGQLERHQRPEVNRASEGESDKYEELFVNPTLLKAASQRGNLDCGGLRYLLIGYGNFFQLVVPAAWGHLSICFELDTNPLSHLNAVLRIMDKSAGL